jgi:hypothetical protein
MTTQPKIMKLKQPRNRGTATITEKGCTGLALPRDEAFAKFRAYKFCRWDASIEANGKVTHTRDIPFPSTLTESEAGIACELLTYDAEAITDELLGMMGLASFTCYVLGNGAETLLMLGGGWSIGVQILDGVGLNRDQAGCRNIPFPRRNRVAYWVFDPEGIEIGEKTYSVSEAITRGISEALAYYMKSKITQIIDRKN